MNTIRMIQDKVIKTILFVIVTILVVLVLTALVSMAGELGATVSLGSIITTMVIFKLFF